MPKPTEPLKGSESPATPETGNSTRTDPEAAQGATEPQEDTFPRHYVEELRTEAREARERAQRADFLATEVRRLATREAARLAGLVDPEALTWREEWETSEGIDHQAIERAARALVAERPHLGRPRGDVGQGQHGSSEALPSLSALLRG